MNVSDLDFNNDSFVVTRKGGNRQIIYFWDEVEAPLLAYLDERAKRMKPCGPMRTRCSCPCENKRMSVRAVQEMVKKYSRLITPLKKITPQAALHLRHQPVSGDRRYLSGGRRCWGHSDINLPPASTAPPCRRTAGAWPPGRCTCAKMTKI